MFSFKTVLLGAVAVTASVIKRDAASVQNSLETINSDLIDLTNKVNNYNGGLFAALPIQNAESNLEDDINSATSTAQASDQLSSSESTAIINYIDSTLEPHIAAALQALVNKKSQFQSAGLAGTVRGDLNTLKSDTDDLGAALINIASEDTKAAGQDELDQIDADFNKAIAAYA